MTPELRARFTPEVIEWLAQKAGQDGEHLRNDIRSPVMFNLRIRHALETAARNIVATEPRYRHFKQVLHISPDWDSNRVQFAHKVHLVCDPPVFNADYDTALYEAVLAAYDQQNEKANG